MNYIPEDVIPLLLWKIQGIREAVINSRFLRNVMYPAGNVSCDSA